MDLLILLATLVGLLVGGHYFVASAAAVGRYCGMSQVFVGATIVAIGTSLPEWAISVISSSRGQAELATGNVIGSNLCNVCIILGIAALIAPIPCSRTWLRRDGSIMMAATMAFLAVTFGGVITRPEGIGLLCLAVISLVLMARFGDDEPPPEEKLPFHWWQIPVALLALGVVLLSCHWFVESATNLARQWHVSEWLIGLTVAAVGTSMPELVTAVAAARQKKGGLIVGNVLGSNTMNICFVLGSAATVHPLANNRLAPVATMTFVALMMLPLILLRTGLILRRSEGALLVILGVAWLAFSGGQ